MAMDAEVLKQAMMEDTQTMISLLAAAMTAQQVRALANQYRAATLVKAKAEARRIAGQLQSILDRADQTDSDIITWKTFVDANISLLPVENTQP